MVNWWSWSPFEGSIVRESRWVVRFGEYRFHRAFFLGVVVLLCVLVASVYLGSGGGVHLGWSCPESSRFPCENPFLDKMGSCMVSDLVVCGPVTLLPGQSVGEATPWLVQQFPWLVMLILVAAFVANHLVMNRGWKF